MLKELNTFSENTGLNNMGLSSYFHTVLKALIGHVIPGGIILSVFLVTTPSLLGHLQTLKDASHLHYPVLLFVSLFLGVTCNGLATAIFQLTDRAFGVLARFDTETFNDYCRHRYLALEPTALLDLIPADLKQQFSSTDTKASDEVVKIAEVRILDGIKQDASRRYFRGASSIPLMLGNANPNVREQLKNTLSALEAELMFCLSMSPVPIIVSGIIYYRGGFSLPIEECVSWATAVILVTGVWIYQAYHSLKTYRSRLIMFYLGLTLAGESKQ